MSQNYITVFDKYKIRQEDYFNSYQDSDKKYYLEPQNNEELKEKINQQEEFLKKYKYYEDIPRLFQNLLDWTSCIHHLILLKDFYQIFIYYLCQDFTAVISSVSFFMVLQFLQGQYNYKKRSIFWGLTLFAGINLYSATRIWLSITNQPQNKGIYAPFRLEKKVQNQFDLQYDLYKNNQKLKYEDQYIDPKEADKILRQKEIQFENERRKIWRELKL